MAFLVLGLGGLMALVGAYEIYIGNSIISVERGWSAFISGTVLLTGGLVTVALGLAIHALADLKRALAGGVVATSGAVRNEPLPTSVVATSEMPAVPLPDLRPSLTHDWEDSAGPALPMPSIDDPPADRHASVIPAAEATYPAQTHDASLLEEHASPALRASLDAEPPATPAMDDWLERSFADLDRDSARDAARAVSARAHPAQDDLTHADLAELHHPETWDDHPRAELSPSVEQAPAEQVNRAPEALPAPTQPEPAAESSPVIGRYEAEGTSYVMYADGSIEAQSAAGVYRFASMAELKTFIES